MARLQQPIFQEKQKAHLCSNREIYMWGKPEYSQEGRDIGSGGWDLGSQAGAKIWVLCPLLCGLLSTTAEQALSTEALLLNVWVPFQTDVLWVSVCCFSGQDRAADLTLLPSGLCLMRACALEFPILPAQ